MPSIVCGKPDGRAAIADLPSSGSSRENNRRLRIHMLSNQKQSSSTGNCFPFFVESNRSKVRFHAPGPKGVISGSLCNEDFEIFKEVDGS